MYICKHRAWSTDRSSAGCTSTNSRCIVGFSQPLFDKVADEPLRAAVVVCSGAVRDNSKCVFRCSGVCTCISVFFRLRGLLLLIIDYLALLRALLSVLFSRVSVCASESTHQRTNAMAGDSVLRNISLEHLRRGHAPTGGEEIVLDKRTRTVGRTSHPYFSLLMFFELNRSRDLFYYSRAALCSTAILAQACFFSSTDSFSSSSASGTLDVDYLSTMYWQYFRV